MLKPRYRGGITAWILTCGIVAAVCGVAQFVSAQPIEQGVLKSRLESRMQRLNQLYVEFEWWEFHPSLKSDPFDPNVLAGDPTSFLRPVKMWILRPWYRIERYQTKPTPRAVEGNWVDGVCTSKTPGEDDVKWWSVTRDINPWRLIGPLPMFTPLELGQIFDARVGLFDLAQSGKLNSRVDENGKWLVSCDEALPPPLNWTINAQLDPDRDLLPVNLRASLPFSGGAIHWEMRTLAARPFDDSWLIEEAIIAMKNTGQAVDRWQVYQFKLITARRLPTLSRNDLQISIPTTNVRINDEIERRAKHVDASGVVTLNETWTPEQRAADRRAMVESQHLQRASGDLLAARQRVFRNVIVGTVIAAVIMGVALVLHRRRMARA